MRILNEIEKVTYCNLDIIVTDRENMPPQMLWHLLAGIEMLPVFSPKEFSNVMQHNVTTSCN